MKHSEPYLNVLGKVQPDLRKQVISSKRNQLSSNAEWFFIDFSESDVPVGEKFNIYKHSDDDHDWSINYKIILKGAYDQSGNKLDRIERGLKAIGYLEFSPHIPSNFKNLPVLKGWKYQKKSIIVGKKESFAISTFTMQSDKLIEDYGHILFIESKSKWDEESFSEKDWYSYFSTWHLDKNGLQIILIRLISQGKIKKEGSDKLALVGRETNRKD